MQRSYFCLFLTQIGIHTQDHVQCQIQMLKMPWVTSDNVEDCGVFLMCHMETYKGEREGGWNCGLKKSSSDVLQSLRAKYCSKLMLAENVTTAYYKDESKHTVIDVEKMIAAYLKKK